MSSQVPRSATSIYGGIVAAVITIAISIVLFRKLWETVNKSRIPKKQGHTNTSQPQFINQDERDEDNFNVPIPADCSTGDEGQLDTLVLSTAPQFIDQDSSDKNISIPAQASITSRLHGDIASEGAPLITLSQGPSNFQLSEANATVILNGNGRFTKIQRKFICDYIANLPNINNSLKERVLAQPIIALPRAEAGFKDYRNKKNGCCLEATRVALLREMADCVTGSSEYRMYILSGLAGLGKSMVAHTIASRAADLNMLGASFFFSRDGADRNNAKRFFTTVAYQLCIYNETFAKAIGNVLKTERGSAATTEDPQKQLHTLLLVPLRSIVQSHSRPILIVIDALHECDEADAILVLNGLSQFVQNLPSFKVILTTHPQPYLDRFLSSQGGRTFFHLQNIENKVVDDDIRPYLNHCLSLDQIQKCFPKRQWCASDEEIDSLVHAAGRHFITALTGVRYILDKTASNPAAQMQKLLRASTQDHTYFKGLDRFYTVMLRDVVPEDCDDDDIVIRYKSIIGVIIFVQHPLPVSILSHLIDINVQEIHAVLDKLQSVILLGDDDIPGIYHKSFLEYLTDEARCKDPHLRIDPKIHHTQIATRCFEIMNKHLKYNILGLGDPARFMSNEDNLEDDGMTDEQVEEKIPQQLRYACVYWVNHLEVANTEDVDLVNGLKKFLTKHVLHWFEFLSLVGKLDSAQLAIRGVLKYLKSSSDLYQLLLDALRFIGKFYGIIERSALHTYYSALRFTPTDSLLYRRYIEEVEHNIWIEGGREKWDALIANPNHGYQVNIVKFSLDSTLLVSCSDRYVNHTIQVQGKLKIWDAITGTPISTVLGDELAFANDFSTVASSEDKTITCYNMDGSPNGTVFTTSSEIRKLALSSESGRVAAGLADGTIWLWDSGNAELIDKIKDHAYQLKFSRTGTRLAYSLADGIRLRDGISGRFITDLQCGSCHKFEFSGDGSRIASVSRENNFDDRLRLWNSESGELIGDIWVKYDYGDDLAISANGSLLATNSTYDFTYEHQVTLWGENDNSLAQIKVLEFHAHSVAFSLDNILAIATYSGIMLYNVKTHSFIHTLPLGGFSTISTLAFSPDCIRFAIGDHYDNYLNLYDIRGIDSFIPSKEEADGVIALTCITVLALSQDCSRLACGFKDGTVELLGTSPTKRRIASHRAHMESVGVLEFGPNGGLFASGSDNLETIKLWSSKDGSLRGTLKAPSGLTMSVALSNSVLVAAGNRDVTLWSLDTLSLIHTFDESSYEVPTVSIAENNALIAVAHSRRLSLLDAENYRTITTFDVLKFDKIHAMTFLPDNSQLVAHSKDGVFLSFNLINKYTIQGPTLEHLVQLPNIPIWRGVPVWYCRYKEHSLLHQYLAALFPQHKSPVPVLWIPRDVHVMAWTQGSSIIALYCEDGRIILLRLPTSHGG